MSSHRVRADEPRTQVNEIAPSEPVFANARTVLPASCDWRPDTRSLLESVPATENSGLAGLTDYTLSCAARAHVPKPERRGGCRR